MDEETQKFLGITEIPQGKSLTIVYKRLVGIFANEEYTRTVTNTLQLTELQEHIRTPDDSYDAIAKFDGFKYAVVSLTWN